MTCESKRPLPFQQKKTGSKKIITVEEETEESAMTCDSKRPLPFQQRKTESKKIIAE